MRISLLFLLSFSFSSYFFASVKDSILLRGKVIDSSNEPLIGVTIFVKGTTFSIVTDINGSFELKLANHFIESDSITVIFNFPYGYQTQEKVYTKSKLMQTAFEKIIMEREPIGTIVVSSKFNKNSKIESVELTPERILQIQKSRFKGCGSPGVPYEQIKKLQKRKQKNLLLKLKTALLAFAFQ